MNNRNRVASIMNNVLKIEIPLDLNVQRNDCAAWDSLKHFELIFNVEEEFQLRFSTDQIQKICSLEDILATIEGMHE